MKIALLKAYNSGVLGLEMITFSEPLGLECLAGVIERCGHECIIVDMRITGIDKGMKECLDFGPDVVGIQCNFTTERYRAIRLAERVKADMNGVMVILGGHDATRSPEWFNQQSIDLIVTGDGECVVPDLLEAIDAKRDLRKVKGLIINAGGSQTFTGAVEQGFEFRDFPLPSRHLIKHYAGEYYINFNKPLALMETARGCPFKCNFCSVWKFHKGTFREKPVDMVVEELKMISAPHVFFTDDIFWMNAERSKEMAVKIKEAGIRKFFRVQTRSDIICRHPELVELWMECGNINVFLGIESVDDRGLESVNKRNKASNNMRALEILKETGAGYTPNLIVHPDWEKEDFRRVREWISETGSYNSGFTILTPLPGTDLWETMKDKVTTDNWELFDIVHAVLPTRLPLEDFYAEYANLWRSAMEVRYRERGKFSVYMALLMALVSGRVDFKSLKKGMNIAASLSDPSVFLKAHHDHPVSPGK